MPAEADITLTVAGSPLSTLLRPSKRLLAGDLITPEWLQVAESGMAASEMVCWKSGRPPIDPCQPFRQPSALPESRHSVAIQ
jgi:hypothetical protein